VKLPVWAIPLVGSLFTSYDDSVNRTDVLLTVTPRVVRGWDVPTRSAARVLLRTENVYSDKPLFAGLRPPWARKSASEPGGGRRLHSRRAVPGRRRRPWRPPLRRGGATIPRIGLV